MAEQLFAEGFLELEKGHPAGQAWWITTTKGNALAMASFGKPITRPTADRLLGGLIERAAAWNTNDDRLISVEQLVVFGSYLDPAADRLGDLDIAAAQARWPPGADRQDWVKRRLAHGQASGRTFATFVDELFWPEDEAKMMLRNRSAVIKVTTEDIRNLTTRFAVVYTRATSPDRDSTK